ncbi:MAG: CDF family Co(II)/Ni(II) efflux transporter DmeF [Thermoanaerobaculia bacterium]
MTPTDPAAAAHEACATGRRHEHVFGQDRPRPGERGTRIVIALTVVTMALEIGAGLKFGSMALLADGLHMGSHAAALGISAFAYAWVRRHAADPRFSFGAGKMNALAGFAGAVLLAGFALLMAWESVERLLSPVPVAFSQAIAVAVLGLAVNAASALVLTRGEVAHDGHDDGRGPHGEPAPGRAASSHGHDHNLRSAYLHVLADAVTSLLAIGALLGGALLGWQFLDPLIGIVGAAVITRWSVGLLRESGHVLLDRQAPAPLLSAIREAIEARAGDRVSDLHVWRISPDGWSAIVSVVSADPLAPDGYRALLPDDLGLAHVNVEVLPCPHAGDATGNGETERRARTAGAAG